MISRLWLGPILLLAVASCSLFKSTEEQLIELRHEQRQLFDDLHALFGGGPVAEKAQKAAEQAAAEQAQKKDAAGTLAAGLFKALGGAVGDAERAVFEAQCLESGRGERPTVLSDKSRTFFARPDVQSRCKRAAVLQVRIDKLSASR